MIFSLFRRSSQKSPKIAQSLGVPGADGQEFNTADKQPSSAPDLVDRDTQSASVPPVIDSFRGLDPGAFFRGDNWSFDKHSIRKTALDKYRQFYEPLRSAGATAYDLDRISTAIFYLRTMLQRHNLSGPEKTALEIGCGNGNKSLAVNDLFGRYVGVDLLPDQIEIAKRRAQSIGANNTQFICDNAAKILRSPGLYDLPGKIDVLVLYAVVEHLTLDERPQIMRLADQVIADGGTVILMEAPNRLLPFDAHTTGTHFFNWLPDQLAHALAKAEMVRREMADNLSSWESETGEEELYRLGRGVSYHDLQFGLSRPLAQYGFPVSSFNCETLNMEPLQFQEIALLGHLSANVDGIPAGSFSRSWVDTVISGNPSDTQQTNYISPHWPDWIRVSVPPVFWYSPSVVLGQARSEWTARPNIQDVDELNLVFSGDGACFAVSINGTKVDSIDLASLKNCRLRRWHDTYSIAYKLSTDLRELRIGVENDSPDFHFQGAFASTIAE